MPHESGVKGKGGLTISLERLESFKIGDDVEVILQKNNTPGCTQIQLRVIAPKELPIVLYDDRGYQKSKIGSMRPSKRKKRERLSKLFEGVNK